MENNNSGEPRAQSIKSELSLRSETENGKIDLVALVRRICEEWRSILWWCAAGAIIGIVVAFSIPKEYTVSVKLAPEIQSGHSVGAGSAIADMIGINLDPGNHAVDAVYPALYPDIVASTPFLTELFNVPVTGKGEYPPDTNVFEYVVHYTKEPWWKAIFTASKKAVGWIASLFGNEKEEDNRVINTFRLTRDQMAAVKTLKKRIEVSVDKKSSVVLLSVTMQDPLIAAALTDTVMHNLQDYITRYRTNKARNDLAFTQKLFDEAREDYYRAQAKYAQYMDANHNVVLRSVRTENERLQNEMNLAYNIYNQTAQQLQAARAKVQESMPVYVVIQPAIVPLKASKPSKVIVLFGCVLLAGVVSIAWLLYGKEFFRTIREQH